MNVLYISYDGLTDPLGQSQIVPYLIACSSNELKFTVISFEKKHAFDKGYSEMESILDKASITWIPKTYTKWPPLLSSLLDLIKMIRTSKRIIRKSSFQLIHCRSYIPAFAAFYIKRTTGIKILFDMRGFWADERIEGHIWSSKNFLHQRIYKYLKSSEKKWWNDADHMVSLTEKGKGIILNETDSNLEKKISVIPCCADENLFTTQVDASVKANLKKELSIQGDEKVLIYVGSLGTWYLSDEMMAQFAQLLKRGIMNRFLWITKDSEDDIMGLADKWKVPRASIIVRSAKRDEVPLYLSIADLGIFYIKSSFSKSASSPTKLGEMLLCGLPVIANSGVGDLDTFFKENDVGYVHDVTDPKSFNIEDQPIIDLLTMSKDEIREVGLNQLSLKKATQQYLNIYNSLK